MSESTLNVVFTITDNFTPAIRSFLWSLYIAGGAIYGETKEGFEIFLAEVVECAN